MEMEYKTNKILSITGMTFVIVSAGLFYLPGELWVSQNSTGLFSIHYILGVLYCGILIVDGIRRYGRRFYKIGIDQVLLILILFTISAFALNREVSVFDESVLWLSLLIVLQCITFFIYPFVFRLPKILLYTVFFIWGINIWLYLYFTIYLFPLLIPGIIGLLLLGITIHLFVPFLSLLALVFEIYKKRHFKGVITFTSAGFILAFGIVVYSTIKWNEVNNFFKDTFHHKLTVKEKPFLPEWAQIAQKIPQGYYYSQFMKLDMIYVNDLFSFRGFNLHDQKRHDPLVNLMSNLFPIHPISHKDKLQILRVSEDLRHQAEDRIWSGKDLKTDHIINRIEVYPQYRISYTDLIMTIHNKNSYKSDQQEALYTFYLPDGAVATSLSLWIEGEERKARFTTKQKADNAYTTIVTGMRDPSVVHWQEGNRLQVRVFPCTPQEPRVFRVGITAPLAMDGDKLRYQPVYFKGPSTADATEHIEIYDMAETNLIVPARMENNSMDRDFKPGFSFTMEATDLSEASFNYQGMSYSIHPEQTSAGPVNIEVLYLDINKEWSTEEIDQIINLGLPVKILDTNKISSLSKNQEYSEQLDYNFSFIPFHLIPNPENTLIVTKGTSVGPFLKDLNESRYLKQLNKLDSTLTFKIFSLNNRVSPYLKTMEATKSVVLAKGTLSDLEEITRSRRFPILSSGKNSVTVPNAGIRITKSSAKEGLANQAPDHLLRLYASLSLMKRMELNYLFGETPPEELYKIAEQAFAVTPFSSLIVLEQLRDYERFDIQKNKDTLGNADLNNSGAVPEPHEWLLIIVMGILVSVLLFNKAL